MNRFLLTVIGLFIFSFSFGQAYVTSGTGDGNWGTPASWTPAAPAGGPTAANSTSITVNHNTNFNVNASVDQMTVSGGVTLTINAGNTMTVGGFTTSAITDLTVNGTIIVNGALTMGNTPPPPPPPKQGVMEVNGTIQVLEGGQINGSTTTAVKFNAGSVYDHQYTVASGTVPTATWDPTSTCQITGTPGGVPSGLGAQTFGNFTWNTPGSFTFYDLNGALTDIDGNLNITSSPGYLYLTFLTGYTLNIDGNFNVATEFAFTDAADVTVNVLGNVTFSSGFTFLTGGNNVTMDINGSFTVSGGTHDFTYDAGNTTINLAGNLNLTGGTLTKSGTGTQTINFDGSAAQLFSGGATISNSMNYVVENLAILDLGTAALTGGAFTLDAGGTLRVGSTDASGALQTGTTAGNMRVSGTRTYTAGGNIVYNGASAQTIGNGFPSTAVNLEINNSAGVTNNNTGTTNLLGTLTLTSGPLFIGNNNTLDVQSDFISSGGTIGGDVTSDLTFSGNDPLGTLSFEAGSQQIRNLTNDRAAALVLGSDLTIVTAGTLDLTGNIDFSGQSLTINGNISGSGTLVSNASSDLIIGGSGAFGNIPFVGTGSLNDLTLGRTSGGTYTINSNVTINNAVNLNFGTLTHTSGLTMAANSTFFRAAGSITGTSPTAVSSYNVTYPSTGSGNTGLELPTSATALNNLTISSGGAVNLQSDITINGTLSMTSGTFDAGTNDITMSGPSWSATGGTFTINAANTVTFDGTTSLSGSSINGTQFGNLTIGGTGNVTFPSENINVSGTWDNTGTFNAGGGTVTFNGSGQTLSAATTTFNNVIIGGAGTVTLGAALDVNNNIVISSTLDVGVGNNSINVGGLWSNLGTLTFRQGTVTFDGGNQIVSSNAKAFYNVNFAGTGVKTITDALDVNGDLTITSTLTVGGVNNDITLDGDWINNGTFNASSDKVIFNGTDTQDITGSSVTTFNDMDIGNTSTLGVRVESNQNLAGILTVTDASSKFDADGSGNSSVFTLLSTADNPSVEAAIAALPTPANFTGDVTVQRYMSGEGRIWRYLASPVTGQTVADWQMQFPITGSFTGADDLGGANNPSLYNYDETVVGSVDQGWTAYPVSANTEPIVNGTGYSTYIREETLPTIVEQTGPIGKDNFNYPVTFTSSGTASNDGWNLLGNPYPSALDWEDLYNGSQTNNINPTMYIRDNGGGGGVYATWNATLMSGTNGGTKNIALGQSFWVQANNTSPALRAEENMKATDGSTIRFFEETPIDNLLRITLIKDSFRDEVIQHFNENAEDSFEDYDSYKLKNDIYDLSIMLAEGEYLTINALKELSCSSEIFLNIELGTQQLDDITNGGNGTFKLEFKGLNSFPIQTGFLLTDHFASETFTISELSEYEFEISGDPASFGDQRFSLIFTEYNLNTELELSGSPVCDQVEETNIQIAGAEDGVLYQAFLGTDPISDEVSGAGEDLSLMIDASMLATGENEVIVKARFGTCSQVMLSNSANIIKEPLLTVEIQDFTSTCSLTGTLTLGDLAEGAMYQVFETGAAGEPIIESTSNVIEFSSLSYGENLYYVKLTESNGCESNLTQVSVSVSDLETPSVTSFSTDCGSNATLDLGTLQSGSSYKIYANESDNNPIISTNESTVDFSDLQDGIVSYFVAIENDQGCEGERVLASVMIFSSTPVITIADDILETNIEQADSYQWYLDGSAVEGATSSTFDPEGLNGSITVDVTIGDCIKPSEAFLVTGLEEDLADSGFAIFPNPVERILKIEYDHSISMNDNYDYKIYDQTGKLEISGKISEAIQGVDVSSLSDGPYIFMVISEQSTIFSARFIKK